jgi:hypothetical protein
LARKYEGRLTLDAAQEGLALYAEVVADARARPGAHPNIDLLLGVLQAQALQEAVQQQLEQPPAPAQPITIVVETK